MDLILSNISELSGGLLLTIQLTACALIFGFFLATPLAIGLVEGTKPLKLLLKFYTMFFRGTPLLVQIFLIYYGLGQFELVRASPFWTLLKQPFFCAVLALSLNTSAYTANIIRGAIQAVPFGEIEAGRAYGMNRLMLYRQVILPQAFRLFLPAYGNEVIIILKATSLASTITLMDLTGVASNIMANTYRPFEIFIAAALIYITLTFILSKIFARLELHLNRQAIEW